MHTPTLICALINSLRPVLHGRNDERRIGIVLITTPGHKLLQCSARGFLDLCHLRAEATLFSCSYLHLYHFATVILDGGAPGPRALSSPLDLIVDEQNGVANIHHVVVIVHR